MKNRKTTRLAEYNYSSSGQYFVTICTHNKENIFGEIVKNKMVFNNNGKIVKNVWETLVQIMAAPVHQLTLRV